MGFIRFTDEALDYLTKWTDSYSVFSDFSWADLRTFPDWTIVNKSIRAMAERTKFDRQGNSTSIFNQFGYDKNYCTDAKLAVWKDKNMQTEERWVEIFRHMNKEDVPFKEFAYIIEFALCFPGTSASVERIFAKADGGES